MCGMYSSLMKMCNTMLLAVTPCNTLQHTTARRHVNDALQHDSLQALRSAMTLVHAFAIQVFHIMLQFIDVSCSVLRCVVVCCSVMLCKGACARLCYTGVSPRCGVLQCAAVCCSVLQCAAVCCCVRNHWPSALSWRLCMPLLYR